MAAYTVQTGLHRPDPLLPGSTVRASGLWRMCEAPSNTDTVKAPASVALNVYPSSPAAPACPGSGAMDADTAAEVPSNAKEKMP